MAKTNRPRQARQQQGANERLWAQFQAEHPAEAATIANRDPRDPVLGAAYASVFVFDERDYNADQALRLVRVAQERG